MSSAFDLYIAGHRSTLIQAARIASRYPYSVETLHRLLELADGNPATKQATVEGWLADDRRKGKKS